MFIIQIQTFRRSSLCLYTNTHSKLNSLLRIWYVYDMGYYDLNSVLATMYHLVGFNALRPWQNGRHFPDDIFECIFMNGNTWISIKNSLKIAPKVLINNIPALVQIMAWRRPGDKPLSEPMLVSLLTHICVIRPQWVNTAKIENFPVIWALRSWFSIIIPRILWMYVLS